MKFSKVVRPLNNELSDKFRKENTPDIIVQACLP